MVYRRFFTQPRSLATLRAEFDAAVHEGSEHGTTPELLELLQGHAGKITRLMTRHWESVINGTEEWPKLRSKQGRELLDQLQEEFAGYVDKTVHWLHYFILDPAWLNLSAVNYSANAAREAASEVRQVRLKFEEEYELERADLATKSQNSEPQPAADDSEAHDVPDAPDSSGDASAA